VPFDETYLCLNTVQHMAVAKQAMTYVTIKVKWKNVPLSKKWQYS